MTATPTIPYYSAQPGNCPLCHKRPVWKKMIYGHPVCKKCFYAFANRRQLGYIVDALILIVPAIIISTALLTYLRQVGVQGTARQIALMALGIPVMCLFIMKDGFTGQSPGKRLTNVQVLDDSSRQPIGFGQSFKRNSVLLVGQIPVVGSVLGMAVVVVIALQMAKGYRLGDRFARTRVIWKKYADLPVFGGDALVCESCGYNLQGNVSGVCPECGAMVSERNAALLSAG